MKVFAWFLFGLFSVVHSSAAVEDARLRGGRRAAADEAPRVFRITHMDDLYYGEDGKFDKVEQTTAIPIIDGRPSDKMYNVALPDDILQTYASQIAAGTLYLEALSAHVSNDDDLTVILEGDITILDNHPDMERQRRQLAKTERTLAVVRVAWGTDPNNFAYTEQEIRKRIFTDDPNGDISLAKQFRLCSQGNMIFKDAGIHTITIPGSWQAYPAAAQARNLALDTLTKTLGVGSVQDIADHVMVMIPDNGYPGFVGNAGVNHWVSTYNSAWSLDVMVYMHELGHNLGLNHAT